MSDDYLRALKRVADAAMKLPFGESVALPWCRESFPELDEAIKSLEAIIEE